MCFCYSAAYWRDMHGLYMTHDSKMYLYGCRNEVSFLMLIKLLLLACPAKREVLNKLDGECETVLHLWPGCAASIKPCDACKSTLYLMKFPFTSGFRDKFGKLDV